MENNNATYKDCMGNEIVVGDFVAYAMGHDDIAYVIIESISGGEIHVRDCVDSMGYAMLSPGCDFRYPCVLIGKENPIKTITRTMYRIDRVWYNVKDRMVVGDMSFTFADADNTRSFDYDEMVRMNKECIAEEIGSMYDKNDTEEVPIYLFMKTEATLKVEPGEDVSRFENDPCSWEWKLAAYEKDVWTEVGSLCVCTPKYAKKIGIPEKYQNFYFE